MGLRTELFRADYQGYWDDWFKQAGDHLPLAIHISPAPDIPIPHDCPPEGCAVP